MGKKFYTRIDNRLVMDMGKPDRDEYLSDKSNYKIYSYDEAMKAYNSRPSYPINPSDEKYFKEGERYEEGKDFSLFDSDRNWWAVCENCKWEGSSKDCGGGNQIADTGDYHDCTCPKCHSTSLEGESRYEDIPQYKGIIAFAIPKDNDMSKEEKFLPPDSDDICWYVGSETFTRKEVYYLLHAQRSMISNDLKTYAGNELTENIYAILNHPRIPKY